LFVCGGVQEFASVFECAVDVAGAAIDATFGEEVVVSCRIQFSSGNLWEGLLLSLSGTDSSHGECFVSCLVALKFR
jgi:hypothetical protein